MTETFPSSTDNHYTKYSIVREKRLVLCVAFFFFLISLPQLTKAESNNQQHPLHSNSIEENQALLKKLQTEIKDLEKELKISKTKKQDAQNQLRLLDTTIGKSNAYIQELGTQIKSYNQELPKLKKQKQTLENNLANKQQDLAKQIRNAYIMGRQNYLKMLLNQQESAILTRTLVYYDYINKSKTQQIHQITSKLEKINHITQNIKQQTEALETNFDLQIAEKKAIELNYKSRQMLIASLNAQISNKTKKRKSIEQNLQNLANLLNKLEQKEQKKQKLPLNPRKFSKLQGTLSWPVKGKLVRRYGTSRHIGSLKWQGIVIAAPKGKEIHAVSDGLVVFADWLRGFGLLMIIDHGDGYMSLYGQNDSLLKSEGDTVNRNEIIASAGSSGGISENGLYFEIRHKGKPTNPIKWLSRRK